MRCSEVRKADISTVKYEIKLWWYDVQSPREVNTRTEGMAVFIISQVYSILRISNSCSVNFCSKNITLSPRGSFCFYFLTLTGITPENVMPRGQRFTSSSHHAPALTSSPSPFPQCILSLGWGRFWYKCLIRGGALSSNFSQHFVKLYVYIHYHPLRKDFFLRLRAVLIYGYKYKYL